MPKRVDKAEAERRRQAIRAFMARRGLVAATWCNKADLSKNTLYHFLDGRTDSLSLPSLEKLAEAADTTVAQMLGETPLENGAPVIPILVKGAVQAGEWRQSVEWPKEKQYVAHIPREEVTSGSRFALVVVGPSMNRVYPEGSVVICQPIIEIREPLERGERVVVERTDADGRYEITVKELDFDDEGNAWLMPKSDDPAFRDGWKIPRVNLEEQITTDCIDDGTIRVIAVVTGSFRPERRRR